MKKTVQIVLVLLLLICTYHYAQIAGTVSFVQEAAEESCESEMDEEAEHEIVRALKVTVGEAMEIAELAGQEEPKETEESEVQRYYREAIESAQLDWEWVLQPGNSDDFIFLGGTYIAVRQNNGKWGYIDEAGQVVIDLMYDDAGSFSEGKAAVKLEDYTEGGLDVWEYINPENVVVLGYYIDKQVPAFSMYASEFHDGLAYVVDEVPTIINEKGEEVFDSPFFITGYADSKYKAIPGYLFTDDLMKERTYGLVGLDGKCLLEPVFYDVDGPYEDYVRVEVVIDEIPCKGVIRLKEKQPDKNSSLLWKSWIVDGPVNWDDKFGFIITKMSGEEIEGVIVIGDDADHWYWNQGLSREKCNQFKGTIKQNQAECIFKYEECQAEATFFFQGDNRIEAIVKCDQLDMDMCHEFRPKHFSDIGGPWNDDLSSAPVYLETWGEVNLISATTDDNHSNPFFCITDEEGNVLYEGGLINGFVFWDIFVEDLNHDGLQDIWTVLCGSVDNALETGTLVDIFYQTGDGGFYHTWRRGNSGLGRKYLGEYRVTRFCPAENYADISETVLTQEEAEQMIGKKIVIQNKLFVSYDSERRLGVREDRKSSVQKSGITEVCEDSNYRLEYDGAPVSPDVDSGGFYTDAYPGEELRKAVGEEYYEKINGVFYNMYFAW